MNNKGPSLAISKEIHEQKYRQTGESFSDSVARFASATSDNDKHRHSLVEICGDMRFLPAGRVQAAMGSSLRITPWNCFVSGTINDDFNDIMEKAREAGHTLRLGGGIGYDFSTLRPRGALIKSLNSYSAGPVPFMDIYNSVCGTIASAGHRRGAQMGVMRVDHPDIEEFVFAKNNTNRLTNFNVSVWVTDPFLDAVKKGAEFNLKFRGKIYKTVDARTLWDGIMRSNWDWAEPGVLFGDRINQWNNLSYCESIAATNPCGEQPLPPYGACLLGSFNLVKYVTSDREFLYGKLVDDIHNIVRSMDNIIDCGIYPLAQQEQEGRSKRRMGLGITGLANALEFLGQPYGSIQFLSLMSDILRTLRDAAYSASIQLAKEKGSFPLYDDRYLAGKFIQTLPKSLLEDLASNGIRNSHLLSIAPTGTISLAADNVSSGIEPVFTHSYIRTINLMDGIRQEEVVDYSYRVWGIKGKTASELAPEEHVAVLTTAQKYVDSSVSKTCNIGPEVDWESFKRVYMSAYDGGAKGCTTFRKDGKRQGILQEKPQKEKIEYIDDEDEVQACFFDPITGQRTCS